MPVTVKRDQFNRDEDDLMVCFLCSEKLRHGERYIHWGIQFEKEFVQCSFHRAPTKTQIGISVLESYGFANTFHINENGSKLYKINKSNRRGKILNPASPSWLSVGDLISLYENPSGELVTKLIDENLHENKYWKDKAEEELKAKEATAGKDGIRRGVRVLGLERSCSECGVTEAEMVAKNPRYTLCRGVCVVCYRKMYRKNPNVQNNS